MDPFINPTDITIAGRQIRRVLNILSHFPTDPHDPLSHRASKRHLDISIRILNAHLLVLDELYAAAACPSHNYPKD